MKLEKTLKRRVGPLALWVWLVGFVAVVIVYRRYKGGQTTSGDTAGTAGDAGALPAASGRGGGVGAAAGADLGAPDQPLQPVAQTTVDDTLGNGGTGSPVVFDPLTTDTSGPQGVRNLDTPQRYPAQPDGLPIVPLAGGGFYDPNTDTVTPPHASAPRPANTKGQRTKNAPQPSAPAKSSPPPHPSSKANKPAVSNSRAQTTKPASVSPPRSSTESHPDAGARSVAPVSENSPAAQPKATPPAPVRGGTGGGGPNVRSV